MLGAGNQMLQGRGEQKRFGALRADPGGGRQKRLGASGGRVHLRTQMIKGGILWI